MCCVDQPAASSVLTALFNKPNKLTSAFGTRSFSAIRWASQ
jgi:hypothetical protein